MIVSRIPPEFMEELANAIADAFTVEELNRTLIKTTGKSLFKFYTFEHQPIYQIVYAVVRRLDELGAHPLVLSALVLIKPEASALRVVVGKACPEALEAMPSMASKVTDIIAGTQNLTMQIMPEAAGHDTEGRAKLHPLLTEARSELSDLAQALVILDIYKNLHERLHQLQIKQFHNLRSAILDFAIDPLRIDTLQEYQAQLLSNTKTIGRHIDRLPQNGGLRPLETIWYADLKGAVERFKQGLEVSNRDIMLLALRDIRGVMRQVPQRLNAQIFATAGAIPFKKFGETLQRASDALAPANLDIEKARTALQTVEPTINARVLEHKSWQETDRSIAELEELFSNDHPERQDEFFPYWGDAKKRVRDLALLDSGQDWATDVLRDIDNIEHALFSEDTQGKLKRAFGTLRHDTRFQFYAVDESLMSDCTELLKISDPLKALIARLDR